MSQIREAITIILVVILAIGAGMLFEKYVFNPLEPQVYSFTVEDKQVNDLNIYYTIPADTSCRDNFEANSTVPKVNIGTFNPANDVLLLKTYPGERLKFCNPENYNTSESFQLRKTVTQGLFVTPDWIEVGTGKISLELREMSDEEMKNVSG